MRRKKLILDANLLLLLIIGAVEGGRHIKNSNRLNEYSIDDYHVVVKLMSQYNQVFLTPYIATEISNLIDLKGHALDIARAITQEFFSIFSQIDVNIKQDSNNAFFSIYGITDASLIGLVKEYTILTDDKKVGAALYKINPKNIISLDMARSIVMSNTLKGI